MTRSMRVNRHFHVEAELAGEQTVLLARVLCDLRHDTVALCGSHGLRKLLGGVLLGADMTALHDRTMKAITFAHDCAPLGLWTVADCHTLRSGSHYLTSRSSLSVVGPLDVDEVQLGEVGLVHAVTEPDLQRADVVSDVLGMKLLPSCHTPDRSVSMQLDELAHSVAQFLRLERTATARDHLQRVAVDGLGLTFYDLHRRTPLGLWWSTAQAARLPERVRAVLPSSGCLTAGHCMDDSLAERWTERNFHPERSGQLLSSHTLAARRSGHMDMLDRCRTCAASTTCEQRDRECCLASRHRFARCAPLGLMLHQWLAATPQPSLSAGLWASSLAGTSVGAPVALWIVWPHRLDPVLTVG
ncbi:MAG: hypothetical protein E6J34_24270, partial [Chloroflexi bacterium]